MNYLSKFKNQQNPYLLISTYVLQFTSRMSEKKKTNKSGGADWFVQGILSKIGDIFDKMTGRGWNKSSSLSATELIERLKHLLDSEVKDLGNKGRFVPHNIKLKMQWNKFSTDSEAGLKKLEHELLASAIDHINDNLYHTYKPFKIEIKPDYFTDGVKFLASFGEFGEDEAEAEVNVTIPQLKVKDLIPENARTEPDQESFMADFTVDDKKKAVELKFNETKKRISVGRTKENDLMIDDPSISKIHAALVLNPQKMLLVADTGSTNGTFLNGQRIAYGRAFPIGETDKVKFGNVEVFLRRVPKPTDFATQESYEVEHPPTEAYQLEPQPTIASQIAPPTQEVQMLTEGSQPSPQDTVNITSNNVSVSIPKVPEYDFEDPMKETAAGKIVYEENPDEPNATKANLNEEIQVNPTEPRVKLKFDE
jgi:hypothetical protein